MNELFETLRNIKHSNHAPLACPKCGGVKIKQQGSLSGWLLPPIYGCEECGYVGRLVLELEERRVEET